MSDEKKKSGLDEQTFGKLLEAAYLLQEHNRQVRQIQMEKGLDADKEQTLPAGEGQAEIAITLKTAFCPAEFTAYSRLCRDSGRDRGNTTPDPGSAPRRGPGYGAGLRKCGSLCRRQWRGRGNAGGENHSLSRLHGSFGASPW